MQIFFLSLIAALLANCSSKKEPSIPESYAKVLRQTENQLIQVTDKQNLELSDYIVFEIEKNKSITLNDIKDIPQKYKLLSTSTCNISGKKIEYTNHLEQGFVQIKSILPLDFFLSENLEVDCDFNITLEDGKSKKTFKFIGTRIKNFNSEYVNLLADHRLTEISSVPDVITEQDAHTFTITNVNEGDFMSLICENFYTKPVQVNTEVFKLDKLTRYTEVISSSTLDVDPRLLFPYQDCLLYLKKDNGSVHLSKSFMMKYIPIEPQVVFKNHAYLLPDPPDSLNAFSIEFLNPHPHPLTVAIDKTKLFMEIIVTVETCPRDRCRDDIKGQINSALVPNFSSQESIVENERMFLVHLLPNDSLSISFGILVPDNYHSRHKIKWDMNKKRDIIQNLHTNYQNIQSIDKEARFIGTTTSQ